MNSFALSLAFIMRFTGTRKWPIFMLVVLRFVSVDEILKCGHLNESCRAVLSCGVVY